MTASLSTKVCDVCVYVCACVCVRVCVRTHVRVRVRMSVQFRTRGLMLMTLTFAFLPKAFGKNSHGTTIIPQLFSSICLSAAF